MKSMDITFSVNGWVAQTIQLDNDDYTPEQVMDLLKAGEVLTSVSGGGELIHVKDGKLVRIGEVIDSTLEGGEMFDFELTHTWDS